MARILLVDDSEIVLTLFGRALEDAGFLVDTAEDAEKAMDRVSQQPQYDLICTDLNMPGMNGMDLMKLIHEQMPSVPFVVLTTESHPTHKEKAKTLGARAWIPKTASPEQLVSVVRKVLAALGS